MKGEKKQTGLKSLLAIVFIAAIILLAWISIKLVNVAPNAFSSLASLAEGVRQQSEILVQQEETDPVQLTVTSNTTLINSGESVIVSWGTADRPGSYVFSYDCSDGVNLNIIDQSAGTKAIECNTNYNVGDTDSVSVSIDTSDSRYESVNYTVSFLGTKNDSPIATGDASVTVINSEIEDYAVVDDPIELVAGDSTSESEAEVVTPVEETEVVAVTPGETTTFEQQFTYEIPTSNPNGNTDLGTKFLAVGKIVGNTFFEEGLVQEESGAIQFEVKNYGTKTSEEWTFSVTLPYGGTYDSPTQAPLKPNERAVLTIGFNADDSDSHTFRVDIEEDSENNTNNNQFEEEVQLVG